MARNPAGPIPEATIATKGSRNRQLIQSDHQKTVRFPELRRATKFHVACRTADSRTKTKRSVGMDG